MQQWYCGGLRSWSVVVEKIVIERKVIIRMRFAVIVDIVCLHCVYVGSNRKEKRGNPVHISL